VEGLEYRPDRLPAWQRALLVGHDHENLLRQFVHQIIKRLIRTRSSLSANVRLEKVVLGFKKPESRPNSSECYTGQQRNSSAGLHLVLLRLTGAGSPLSAVLVSMSRTSTTRNRWD